ncbi:hypothetical protein GIB67_036886 [Kingdonia uniflora]|uniref:Uncharacterized protein n=1 Tax=Kingdonia uniflora TaxID=39325 RepID=A0A7J7KVQ6_9MAGN|nr:hypothetical protein GIB67_036886 [Kingdonia uniflora]
MIKLKLTRNSNFSDLISLQELQLVKQSVPIKGPIIIRWRHLPIGYFKLNSDGSALTSGLSGTGDIIRNILVNRYDTQLYLASHKVYGGEAKLLSTEKGAKIEGKASLLAALDYNVSMQSEIFISATPRNTHSGLVQFSA